jgi:hypothetical protein
MCLFGELLLHSPIDWLTVNMKKESQLMQEQLKKQCSLTSLKCTQLRYISLC